MDRPLFSTLDTSPGDYLPREETDQGRAQSGDMEGR